MQNVLFPFSKNYCCLFPTSKLYRHFKYAFLFFIHLFLLGAISHQAAALYITVNGVSMNIYGTGSTYILSDYSVLSNFSKCSNNSSSSDANFLGSQSNGTGIITYSAYTALTQLDVYFTGFGSAERMKITPPSGVTVTAVCGISAKGSGVYGGVNMTAGAEYWQHIRFTSTAANAFTSIDINTTTPGDGWAYYIPVNGAVPICVTPVAITQQLVNQNVCAGSGYSFNLGATGSNLVYNWQFKNSGQTEWASITPAYSGFSNINTGSLYVSNSPLTDNGRQYRVIVSNPCGSVTSNTVTVNIGTPASVTTQVLSTQNICSETNYTWTVKATGTNLTYNWQFYDNNVGSWVNASQSASLFENYNTETLSVKGADALAQNGRYYQVIISAGACSISSNMGKVVVSPALPAPTLSSLTAENNCPGETANINNVITSATPAGSVVRWNNPALVSNPTAVGAGSYKAYYYNSSFAGECLSPGSTSLSVTINSCSTLPVDLISFEGKMLLGGTNELNWITASEKNNDHFEIESSSDARSFETIGWTEGKGTVYAEQRYKFTDTNPKADLTYYRLKQMDSNKTFEYSAIIAVKNEAVAKSFVIYPNPAVNELGIKLDKNIVIAETILYDLHGKRVLFQKNASRQMQIGTLNAGFYTVDIKTTKGESFRQQFLKY